MKYYVIVYGDSGAPCDIEGNALHPAGIASIETLEVYLEEREAKRALDAIAIGRWKCITKEFSVMELEL